LVDIGGKELDGDRVEEGCSCPIIFTEAYSLLVLDRIGSITDGAAKAASLVIVLVGVNVGLYTDPIPVNNRLLCNNKQLDVKLEGLGRVNTEALNAPYPVVRITCWPVVVIDLDLIVVDAANHQTIKVVINSIVEAWLAEDHFEFGEAIAGKLVVDHFEAEGDIDICLIVGRYAVHWDVGGRADIQMDLKGIHGCIRTDIQQLNI